MKYCSKHHKNPDDAVFCNECGERLTRVTNANHICPKCGASNPTDAKFCHSCGRSLIVIPEQEPMSKPEVEIAHDDKHTETFTHSSRDRNIFVSLISELNESFVSNYRYMENFLLGKIGMWACSIMSVISLYGFINCCINESGWGLLHLSIILSYIGICYKKKVGAIAWTVSFIIQIINQVIFMFQIISNDWFSDFIEHYPQSAIIILVDWIGFIIVVQRFYEKRNSIDWE